MKTTEAASTRVSCSIAYDAITDSATYGEEPATTSCTLSPLLGGRLSRSLRKLVRSAWWKRHRRLSPLT